VILWSSRHRTALQLTFLRESSREDGGSSSKQSRTERWTDQFLKEEQSMKHKVFILLATVALSAALAVPVAAPAAPVPQPKPAPAATPAPEPHPEIREALASLRRAPMHMREAAHDFGGHRVDALRATDETTDNWKYASNSTSSLPGLSANPKNHCGRADDDLCWRARFSCTGLSPIVIASAGRFSLGYLHA
jgi:hypothetical protein